MSIESGGWFSRRAAHLMTFGGVFERHPKLEYSFAECRLGWLPFFIQWDVPRELHDARLGGGVGRHAAQPDAPGDRAEIDDRALPRRNHSGRNGLDGEELVLQVHREPLVPVFRRDRFNRVAVVARRIVPAKGRPHTRHFWGIVAELEPVEHGCVLLFRNRDSG